MEIPNYFTTNQLIKRGWTFYRIKKWLKEPDLILGVNEGYNKEHKLYLRKRVRRAETSQRFIKWNELRKPRLGKGWDELCRKIDEFENHERN